MRVGLARRRRDQSQLASRLASAEVFTRTNLSNIGWPRLHIQVAEPVGKKLSQCKIQQGRRKLFSFGQAKSDGAEELAS